MKVSLSWIKEFLPLTQSPVEVAEALTLAGLEEEGIEEVDGDAILDIGLTPNLGHCLSLLGMARELSAILEIPLPPRESKLKEEGPSIEGKISISIEDAKQCRGYTCRLVEGVTVGPSPKWMQDKLGSAGLRPVNNIVDVGNYVMLELGHPLHTFDFDKIEGNITVKKGKSGAVTTLDEEEREIFEGALLIADEKKTLAFAGVMGGLSSSVNEETKNVLIEAAHFTPEAVRKNAKELNLRTDSSHRFERGVDPLGVAVALDRAAELLAKIAGGKVCKGSVQEWATPWKPRLVQLRPERANQILGTQLGQGEIIALLERLEITLDHSSDKALFFSIPSYRNDVQSEIDLIEEVGRMFGFNNIPRRPAQHISSTITDSPLFVLEERTRKALLGLGLQEFLTCDLISPKQAELSKENGLGSDSQIHVLHPASIDQSVLRTSLLPGLLQSVKFNIDRQSNAIAAFEVGHIHFMNEGKPVCEPAAAIILTGDAHPHQFERKDSEVDFFHLKGRIENLLASFGVDEPDFVPSHLHNFHPGRQARIAFGSMELGALGEVHPKHLESYGINQRVYYAEINLHDLMSLQKSEGKTTPLPQFPGSERDWTIPMAEKTPIGMLLKEAKALESPLLESVELLDLYKSEKIGKDRKNATFRFFYRDLEKTLEYSDVEEEHKRVTTHLAEKLRDSVG